MPITVIDKIKQKAGDFKLLDASDINWDVTLDETALPDGILNETEVNEVINTAITNLTADGGTMDTAIDTAISESVASGGTIEAAITAAIADADHLKRVVLSTGSTLPSVGDTNTIYMLPDDSPDANNAYVEYMYINNAWEIIGSSAVDLTDYTTNSDVDTAISTALTKLALTDTAVDNHYVSAVSQVNGVIAVTRSTLPDYTDTYEAKGAVDDALTQIANTYLALAGGTMSGQIILDITPTQDSHVVNKKYVDDVVESVSPTGMITIGDFTTGTTNGTIKVKDTEVAVAGLGTMAYESADRLNWVDI